MPYGFSYEPSTFAPAPILTYFPKPRSASDVTAITLDKKHLALEDQRKAIVELQVYQQQSQKQKILVYCIEPVIHLEAGNHLFPYEEIQHYWQLI